MERGLKTTPQQQPKESVQRHRAGSAERGFTPWEPGLGEGSGRRGRAAAEAGRGQVLSRLEWPAQGLDFGNQGGAI